MADDAPPREVLVRQVNGILTPSFQPSSRGAGVERPGGAESLDADRREAVRMEPTGEPDQYSPRFCLHEGISPGVSSWGIYMDEPTDQELLEEVQSIKRKPAPKSRTYLEEQVQPYIRLFNWQNETLEKDMKAFWIAVHRLNKQKPTYFRETLEWAAKNRLHPLAFVKAVHTILKKK